MSESQFPISLAHEFHETYRLPVVGRLLVVKINTHLVGFVEVLVLSIVVSSCYTASLLLARQFSEFQKCAKEEVTEP